MKLVGCEKCQEGLRPENGNCVICGAGPVPVYKPRPKTIKERGLALMRLIRRASKAEAHE